MKIAVVITSIYVIGFFSLFVAALYLLSDTDGFFYFVLPVGLIWVYIFKKVSYAILNRFGDDIETGLAKKIEKVSGKIQDRIRSIGKPVHEKGMLSVHEGVEREGALSVEKDNGKLSL